MSLVKVIYATTAQVRSGEFYDLPISEVQIEESGLRLSSARFDLGRQLHDEKWGAEDTEHYAVVLGIDDSDGKEPLGEE